MKRYLLPLLAISALVAVLLPQTAAAGGGCHAGPGTKAVDGTGVIIAKCAFMETVVYVEPGEEVTWHNKDMLPHTVTGAGGSWGTYDNLSNGDKVSYAFKSDGVYPYFCALHPSMVGAVVVGDGRGEVTKGAVVPVAPVDEDDGGSVTSAADPTPASSSENSLAMPAIAIALLVAAGVALGIVSRRRQLHALQGSAIEGSS